jgi:glutathione S-transferase
VAKSLTLYLHPLSSYCHKALIALYENDTPFTPQIVDLSDPASNAAFKAVWPFGKFPVLRDEAKGRTIPESSIIVEYLDTHYPGATRLVPDNAELALTARAADRFYDLHINDQIGKIAADSFRPAGKNDEIGVERAIATLRTALDLVEQDMADKNWAAGDVFTMADCAAAPSLFYAGKTVSLAGHPNVARYRERLMARPSYARALKEAEPYMKYFPIKELL